MKTSNETDKTMRQIIVASIVLVLSLIIITVLGKQIGAHIISNSGRPNVDTISVSEIREAMEAEGYVFDENGDIIEVPEAVEEGKESEKIKDKETETNCIDLQCEDGDINEKMD